MVDYVTSAQPVGIANVSLTMNQVPAVASVASLGRMKYSTGQEKT